MREWRLVCRSSPSAMVAAMADVSPHFWRKSFFTMAAATSVESAALSASASSWRIVIPERSIFETAPVRTVESVSALHARKRGAVATASSSLRFRTISYVACPA